MQDRESLLDALGSDDESVGVGLAADRCLGVFKIQKEEAVSAGVRRIKATFV